MRNRRSNENIKPFRAFKTNTEKTSVRASAQIKATVKPRKEDLYKLSIPGVKD